MKKNIDLALIDSIPPAVLTFEAEEWGRTYPVIQALPALYSLLDHTAAVVREGAILGLAHLAERITYPDSGNIWTVIAEIRINDPSPGVRSTAEELIDSMQDGCD